MTAQAYKCHSPQAVFDLVVTRPPFPDLYTTIMIRSPTTEAVVCIHNIPEGVVPLLGLFMNLNHDPSHEVEKEGMGGRKR